MNVKSPSMGGLNAYRFQIKGIITFNNTATCCTISNVVFNDIGLHSMLNHCQQGRWQLDYISERKTI